MVCLHEEIREVFPSVFGVEGCVGSDVCVGTVDEQICGFDGVGGGGGGG